MSVLSVSSTICCVSLPLAILQCTGSQAWMTNLLSRVIASAGAGPPSVTAASYQQVTLSLKYFRSCPNQKNQVQIP